MANPIPNYSQGAPERATPPDHVVNRPTPSDPPKTLSEDFEGNLREWVYSADPCQRDACHLVADRIFDCYQRGLSSLDLSELDITSLPTCIGELKLKQLYLSSCFSIEELPASIGDLTELKEFHVTCCGSLKKLAASIGRLRKLEKLYLIGCSSLEELPASIGRLRKLEEFYLTNTPISSLPHSISSLGRLNYLYLTQTQLTGVPHEIFDLPNSCTIDLTGCPIPGSVLQRIQDRVSHRDYNGPSISYSIDDINPPKEKPLEEILREICLIAQAPSMLDFDSWSDDSRKAALSTWLNKITWTADWKKEETKEALCKRVVKFLECAQNDPEFCEIFFTTIERVL